MKQKNPDKAGYSGAHIYIVPGFRKQMAAASLSQPGLHSKTLSQITNKYVQTVQTTCWKKTCYRYTNILTI